MTKLTEAVERLRSQLLPFELSTADRRYNEGIRDAINIVAPIAALTPPDDAVEQKLCPRHATMEMVQAARRVSAHAGDPFPDQWRAAFDAVPALTALPTRVEALRAGIGGALPHEWPEWDRAIADARRDEALEEAAKDVLRLADNEGVAAGDGKLLWRDAVEKLRAALKSRSPIGEDKREVERV